MTYERLGTLRANPGRRDELIAILLSGTDGLASANCYIYDVSIDLGDPDLLWVREVWEDRESHRRSLQLPETRAAIAAAMPLMTGEVTGHEIELIGGLGG